METQVAPCIKTPKVGGHQRDAEAWAIEVLGGRPVGLRLNIFSTLDRYDLL